MPTEPNPNPSPSAPSPDPNAGTPPATPTQPASGSPATPEAAPTGTDLGGTPADPNAPKDPNAPAAPAATTDLGADSEEPKKDEPAANPYHGAPEGDYEDLKAPDGFVIDETLKAEFTPIAKELGLSTKGVEKLIDYKAKLDKQTVENWGNHLSQLKEQAKADPEIGGAKYNPTLQAAIQARDKFGTPGFKKMLNDYGVGAHPEMIRFLSKVQATMGEKPSLGSGDGQGVVQKPLHEILYKDTP
jgi:hypothetical protein